MFVYELPDLFWSAWLRAGDGEERGHSGLAHSHYAADSRYPQPQTRLKQQEIKNAP